MEIVLPLLILALIGVAFFTNRPVFDSFVTGAKKALPLLVSILPYMAAMLAALNIFRDTGALGLLIKLLAPVLEKVGIPSDLTPLLVLRPFSGSAAIALLDDVYKTCGADSISGLIASVMLGSTETIFYTVALYFGSVGVKKTRHSIPTALISGLVGAVASVALVYLLLT